jgi:mannose-1-phosphate guanylyltransferase
MADVAGRPFLEYLLRQLRHSGFSRVIVCAGFGAERLQAYFGDGSRWGTELGYSIEREPLGTAGALKLAQPRLRGDRWLVLNGDSIFDIPLAGLVDMHRGMQAATTLALARVGNVRRYGSVECTTDGSVTRFVEKSRSSGAGLVNGGVYVIERAALELIPRDQIVSLEREVLPKLIGQGLRCVPYDAFFIDIGVPADFRRAQKLGERLAGSGGSAAG